MPLLLKRSLLAVTGFFFIFAGILHFLKTNLYLMIMPPYVPWHLAMVYVSGIAEIAGGLGLLIPATRRAAAWGLVALLAAVFPANVYMAANHIQVSGTPIAQSLLWARLPLQGLFIWWVLYLRS